MADTKKTSDGGDLGQTEAQKRVDATEEQGYIGTKTDPLPNEAYSLQSGPDAPPLVPDSTTRVGQVNIDAAQEG